MGVQLRSGAGFKDDRREIQIVQINPIVSVVVVAVINSRR